MPKEKHYDSMLTYKHKLLSSYDYICCWQLEGATRTPTMLLTLVFLQGAEEAFLTLFDALTFICVV